MVDVKSCSVGNGKVEVEVEVEAMRKGDFSWHPCKVSLSGVGILVQFSEDNSDPDDIILSTEEAAARLRIRSTPLQGLTCSSVQEGDCVLAKRSRVNLFFDAEVTKVARVRHSSKTHCRCTFTVKWIHNGLEGESAIIPSSALMRISTESIHAHPTIFSFFNTLSTSSCCDLSPSQIVAEGMDCEMDDSELEKQIEQIRNSANISVIEIAEEMLSDKDNGQEKFNQIAAPEVCNLHICLPQSNLPIQTEIKHPPQLPPFTAEEIPESKSPCNPIAACAALASLMSRSSDATEILSFQHDIKGHECPPKSNKSPASMKLSNGNRLHDICLTNNSSKSNNESCLGSVQKYEGIVKELFPAIKPIKETQASDAAGEVSLWESKNEKSSQEVALYTGKHVSSTRNKKPALPTTVEKRNSCESMETHLTSTRRLTRSMARETKENHTVEMKDVTEEVQLTNLGRNLVQERDLLANKENSTFISDHKSSSIVSDKKFKNQIDNRGTCKNNTSVGIQDLRSSKRLTRSSLNGKMKENNEEPERGLRNISTPDMEKGNLSSAEDEISQNPSAGHKRLSTSAKTTQKPGDETTSKEALSQGMKRKAITFEKQGLRSSPRLRFLPRTRSQTKS